MKNTTGSDAIAATTGTRTPNARSAMVWNAISAAMWGRRTSSASRCPRTPAASSTSKTGRDDSHRGRAITATR